MKQVYNPLYYKKNRKRIIATQQKFRTKHKKEVLDYMKQRYQLLKNDPEFKKKRKRWHKLWLTGKNKEWYAQRKIKVREYFKEYYSRMKINPSEKWIAAKLRRRQRERERSRIRRQTESYKLYRHKYEEEHPEKAHRIILKNVIHAFTGKEWINKKLDAKGICPMCQKNVGYSKLTLDHIYPLEKASNDFIATGIKRIYNLNDVQPLCGPCNSSKRNKILEKQKQQEAQNKNA